MGSFAGAKPLHVGADNLHISGIAVANGDATFACSNFK